MHSEPAIGRCAPQAYQPASSRLTSKFVIDNSSSSSGGDGIRLGRSPLGVITTIVCVQLAELPAVSFAVQVMIVVPTGYGAFNGWPSLRIPVTVGVPQLSLANGVPGLIVAAFWPETFKLRAPILLGET